MALPDRTRAEATFDAFALSTFDAFALALLIPATSHLNRIRIPCSFNAIPGSHNRFVVPGVFAEILVIFTGLVEDMWRQLVPCFPGLMVADRCV